VFAKDTDLTKMDEPAIASLRDRPQIPEADGVRAAYRLDNLLLALAGDRGTRFTLFARETAEEKRRIEVDPGDHAVEPISGIGGSADLSHGQKQWLEIVLLLAQEPQLLLVDEPVAGMTDAETEQTAALLREINRTEASSWSSTTWLLSGRWCEVTVLHEGSGAVGRLDRLSSAMIRRSSKYISGR